MNQVTQKLSVPQRLLLFLSAASIAVSIIVPIWRIELDAPQYPEGLSLQIFAGKLGGNVDIINGLNHYIGMKTLHSQDFMEFTLLPYILSAYALAALLVALFGNRKSLNLLLGAFIFFGIISMVDFWRWEYNYGHDLNPDAAIIVPGMAYQPPLIGFKQLLNFGAYSIPDMGGWLIVVAGGFMLLARFMPLMVNPKVPATATIALLLLMASCSRQPVPIKYNKDNCDYCQMTIADSRFAAELMTDKGKVFKFDDLACMLNYKLENKSSKFIGNFVNEFIQPNQMIPLESSFVIQGERVGSPMGGNMAAFSNRDSAVAYSYRLNAELKPLGELSK